MMNSTQKKILKTWWDIPATSFFFYLIFSIPQYLMAQDCLLDEAVSSTFLHANNIKAHVEPSGALFWDGDYSRFTFENQPEPLATIFAQGLWIGGLSPEGDIKLSATSYGKGINNYDFYPGPLYQNDPTIDGIVDIEHCTEWNKTWSITRQEIEQHIADFEDNGIIDNPIAAVMNWPAKGNSNLEFIQENSINTFAPYSDTQSNGHYDPNEGDYPLLPQSIENGFPDQMTWCVFHTGLSEDSGGGLSHPIEIQLMTWAYNCSDNNQLNNTVFVSYKIHNRSHEALRNVKVGFWHDFDIGCYQDDYIGSAPDQNAFFAYNASNIDQECPNVVSAGANPPVQSVTILNRSLSNFINMISNSVSGLFALHPPTSDQEYYNFLDGKFRDGNPITVGANGYLTGGDTTRFLFPGNPNNSEEWSMHSLDLWISDRYALGTVDIEDNEFLPQANVQIDLAYTYHRKEGVSNIGNVATMYTNIARIQSIYDTGFNNICDQINSIETVKWAKDIQLFPNPVNDQLTINYGDTVIDQVQLWDNFGRLLYSFDEPKEILSLSHLPAGIYYLRMRSKGEVAVRKVSKT